MGIENPIVAGDPGRPAGRWRKHRGLIIDALILLLTAVVAYFVTASLDLFEAIYELSRAHESWQLDEFFAVAIVLSVSLAMFALARVLDLRRALREKAAAEEEAQRLARHDPLTGLPNRAKFFEELARRLGSSAVKPRPCGVFVIDLDRFKPVNEHHGQKIGSDALCVLGRRLSDLIGGRGIAARIGGDEFAVLLAEMDDPEDALRLGREIVARLAEPIEHPDAHLRIGGSVGGALYPDDGTTPEQLVHNADFAMSHSKSTGRGTFHFFRPDMDRTLQERAGLERELDAAIRDGEIVPYYQELVELPSGRVIGYEILARWIHPERGMIPPLAFIPYAEESGRIAKLTYALLRRACLDAKDWPKDLVISVNLTPRLFLDPWLPDEILTILAETGFDPPRLQIEITENTLVERVDEVKTALQALRTQGIRVALDDFGTGYSGLYHLLELKVDTLKIDRSFVTEMERDPNKARIVEAVLNLAGTLGLKVTAEGVETADVGMRLALLGCDSAQGYLYGRPRPASEIAADLATPADRLKLAS